MSLTVDQLCLKASNMTGLSDAENSADRADMDLWVNEAIVKVFQDTQCVVTKVTATLVADEDSYALDRGVLTVLNYAQSNDAPSSRITAITAAEMVERRFISSSGAVRYFAVLGGNLLVVSPKPSEASTLDFWAVPVPDAVDTDDDIFDTGLPTYGQRAVEAWLYGRCFEKNRDYKMAQYWDEVYDKECGKVRIAMRRQAGRTLPRSRIGYPENTRSSFRNDVYDSLT